MEKILFLFLFTAAFYIEKTTYVNHYVRKGNKHKETQAAQTEHEENLSVRVTGMMLHREAGVFFGGDIQHLPRTVLHLSMKTRSTEQTIHICS